MESPKVSRVVETIWLIYPASINCQSFPLPCREATVPSKSLKMLSTWAARAVHWHQIHQIRQHFKSYMLSVPEHWRPAWISMNVNDSEWRTPMINMIGLLHLAFTVTCFRLTSSKQKWHVATSWGMWFQLIGSVNFKPWNTSPFHIFPCLCQIFARNELLRSPCICTRLHIQIAGLLSASCRKDLAPTRTKIIWL